MPYIIKKRKGPRPYKIIRKNDGKVVGSSTSMAKAKASIGHRMSNEPNKKHKDGYERKVDNKMKWQGEIDLDKKVIRINKKKAKKKSSVAGTIYHEEYHRKHPKAHEKTVYKKERDWIKRVSPDKKKKYYSLFN